MNEFEKLATQFMASGKPGVEIKGINEEQWLQDMLDEKEIEAYIRKRGRKYFLIRKDYKNDASVSQA